MKKILLLISLTAVFAVLFLLGLKTGSIPTSWGDVVNSLLSYDEGLMLHKAIVDLRMPRVLLTFLVGGALALSGYLMQISINNPLAEPYILGTSSAAALGANIVFFGLVPLTIVGVYMPMVLAFIFAVGATLVVIFVARRNGFVQGSKLLLAGIAMSSLLTSFVALLAYMAETGAQLRTIIFWSLGSFEQARWSSIPVLLVVLTVFTLIFTIFSKQINLLMMGEVKARQLGLNVRLYNNLVIYSAVLLASVAVTLVGAVGFVGLMVPHTVRAAFGVTSRWNVCYTVCLGGFFVMLCDLISRILYPPVGIPIGIITSFFGVPFFVYLLLKKNYSFN